MPSGKDTLIVTGSSGLIGAALCQRAAERYNVIALDRRRPAHLPPGGANFVVDIASREQVRRTLHEIRRLHGEHIASVVHLAGYYDFSGEPSPLYDAVTVHGTGHLLHALQEFQDVGQFLFASTMLVHAPCAPGQTINEDWPLEPKWAYPQSKLEAEQLIRAQRGAIPAVLLRIAGVYDEYCHLPTLAHQIQRIYERQILRSVFPGDSTHGQATLHLDDLLDALFLLIERRAVLPPELPLLVGEPDTVSYEELQRRLGVLIHGEEFTTHEIPKALAKTGAWLEDALPGEEPFIKPWMIDVADDHYALDITRARTVLGWEPRRTLRATLPHMVATLKADPLAWYRANQLTPPDWMERVARPAAGPRPGVAPHGQSR
ncbi:MAG: NAD-dependent epimerase/dehydratase family protein [Pseudomonadota bacterium]